MGLFSFFKHNKKKDLLESPVDLSELKTDMHAHWLPGIDDGAANMDDSISMIKGLHELGYEKLIATPHVMSDFYNNSTDQILEKLELVKKEVATQGIPIELSAAAEYYFDEEFIKRIENKDLLTLNNSNYVLFEFSYINEPNKLAVVLEQLFKKGYKAVLAHPERYPYFSSNVNKYKELRGMGILFQINTMSINGHYGIEAQKTAEYLIDKNWVEMLGSDIHKENHLDSIKKSSYYPKIKELIDSNALINPHL